MRFILAFALVSLSACAENQASLEDQKPLDTSTTIPPLVEAFEALCLRDDPDLARRSWQDNGLGTVGAPTPLPAHPGASTVLILFSETEDTRFSEQTAIVNRQRAETRTCEFETGVGTDETLQALRTSMARFARTNRELRSLGKRTRVGFFYEAWQQDEVVHLMDEVAFSGQRLESMRVSARTSEEKPELYSISAVVTRSSAVR